MPASLATLVRLKTALGDVNPTVASDNDSNYTSALAVASEIVRNYTGRRFEATQLADVPTVRQFEYDGSGYLDIDECQTITAINTKSGFTGSTAQDLTVDQWAAYPLNLPVKTWIMLSPLPYGGISPEMGFKFNLDTLGYRPMFKPNIISITALWGWPAIPEDVIQAVIWTASSMTESPVEYQSESIENYSRVRAAAYDADALPDRAKDALETYIVPKV